jgi:hypothetical protein
MKASNLIVAALLTFAPGTGTGTAGPPGATGNTGNAGPAGPPR